MSELQKIFLQRCYEKPLFLPSRRIESNFYVYIWRKLTLKLVVGVLHGFLKIVGFTANETKRVRQTKVFMWKPSRKSESCFSSKFWLWFSKNLEKITHHPNLFGLEIHYVDLQKIRGYFVIDGTVFVEASLDWSAYNKNTVQNLSFLLL